MDHATVKLLRQAAGYIKEGKQKAARKILVELLRDDPEVDQAWYMLSFTVPLVDRQIYALEQALRANPNNDKALSRLMKLQAGEKGTKEEAPPQIQKPVRSAQMPQEEQESVSGDDLLFQRLLGEDKPEEPLQVEPQPAEESHADEVVTDGAAEVVEEVEPEAKELKEEKYSKRVFGIRRGIFLLVILILIFISIGILGYSDQIKSFIAGGQNGGVGNQGDAAAGDGNGGSGAAAQTPEPTPTSGIDLPPVWTPTPTVLVEPTQSPDSPLVDLSSVLIDFDRLLAPNSATVGEFDEIKAQMSAIMDDVEFPSLNGYIVDDTKIQEVLAEYERQDDYRDLSDQAGLFLTALGLSDSAGMTDSLMQNMWVDPNGTLFFADTGNVLVTDFDTSMYQKSSYAQAVAQNYRNGQVSFADLGIFPMCSIVDQGCEIAYAVAKGEAAFFAEMWAEEYFSETAMEEFLAEPIDWFTVPSDGSPPPFMEASLSLPHMYGKALVDDIFELGRMDAIDDLYDDLPTTTEQLLHLEKYLAHEEAVEIDFVDVSESLGVSWQNVYNGSLGEWKTYLLMAHGADLDSQLDEETAQDAGAGWGGDYAQLFYRLSTEDFVAVVEWAWDSGTDAAQFTNVFSAHLQNQSGANPVTINEGAACFESNAQVDCIFSNDDNVVWIKAPDQSLISLILGEFGFAD
jgi:hypothetical protein